MDISADQHVVVRSPINVYYQCFICGVARMGESSLESHINGRKHQANIEQHNRQSSSLKYESSHPYESRFNSHGTIPVAPAVEEDYYGRMSTEFSNEKLNAPIVGSEWIIRIPGFSKFGPKHFCGLCEKPVKPFYMITHMTGKGHRLKYLQKHFPAIYDRIITEKKSPAVLAYLNFNLAKASTIIEQELGRTNPYVCEPLHYKEFEEVKKVLKRGDFLSRLKKHFKACEHKLKICFQMLPDAEQEKSTEEGGERPPLELFKSCVEIVTSEIAKSFQYYGDNPEKHPRHFDEWNCFWNQQYKTLVAQGKTSADYDLQPEWKQHWLNRIEQLQVEHIWKIKVMFKTIFNVTDAAWTEIEGIPAPSEIEAVIDEAKPLRQRKRLRSDSDDENTPKAKLPCSSILKQSSEIPCGNKTDTISLPLLAKSIKAEPQVTASFEMRVSIISLFRFLLALENELGSMTPTVLRLMMTAVLSKDFENSLQNSEPNCKDMGLNLARELLVLTREVLSENDVQNAVKTFVNSQDELKVLTGIFNKSEPVREEVKQVVPVNPQFTPLKHEIKEIVPDHQITEKYDISREVGELLEIFVGNNLTPKTSDSKELSDGDLEVMLRNFSGLSRCSQKHLIDYLTEISESDPKRVERLQKFLNKEKADMK